MENAAVAAVLAGGCDRGGGHSVERGAARPAFPGRLLSDSGRRRGQRVRPRALGASYGFSGVLRRRLTLANRLGRQANLNADAVTNLGIYCALAAIAGAKIMMFLVDIPYYTEHPGEIFSLSTLQAGGVFYGGLIGALAMAAWYMRKTRLP